MLEERVGRESLKHKILRHLIKDRVPSYGENILLVPSILKIETTNRCNARCIMCGHTFYPKDKLGDMDFDDVKMLIDQANGWIPKPLIQLDLIGESLLYPKTVEGVRYAHDKGMKTRIYTNGQLLTKKMMLRLMSAGLDTLSVTIDGFTKETYEKIRPGLNFETVTKNMLDAWELCRNSRTWIESGVVVMEENKHEVKQIQEFWSKRCHKFFVNLEIGGIDPKGDYQPGRVGATVPRRLYSHCMNWTAWTQLAVRTNGDVPMCSKMYRWGSDPCMGNAFEVPLLKMFNSPEWDDYRQRIEQQRNLPYQCKLLCFGFGGEKNVCQ